MILFGYSLFESYNVKRENQKMIMLPQSLYSYNQVLEKFFFSKLKAIEKLNRLDAIENIKENLQTHLRAISKNASRLLLEMKMVLNMVYQSRKNILKKIMLSKF